MSDNATLPATGVPVRSLDRAGVQTQVIAVDYQSDNSDDEAIALIIAALL